jgi:peptide deformylase
MILLNYSDKNLKRTCDNFDFLNPPFDPIEFSQNLVKTMYDNNGICLSAPQVGISYRIFAMRGSPENFVCFNPRIVMPGTEEIRIEETSLTYPGLCVNIKRPRHCKVRFATPNGEIRTETYTGITARVFQHCMDYLNGEVFYHKANYIHKQKALKNWRKIGGY